VPHQKKSPLNAAAHSLPTGMADRQSEANWVVKWLVARNNMQILSAATDDLISEQTSNLN